MTSAQTVELPADEVRVVDVMSLDCIAPAHRSEIGRRSIASISGTHEITRAALASLIRRRVPALAHFALGAHSDAVIRLRPPAREATSAVECYAARGPIEAGDAITADNVEHAPCPVDVGKHAALRYDRRHGVTRAAASIAAGDPLGRIIAPPATITDIGDPLTLRIAVGPVTIERRVEAVQSSSGSTVFVRDPDGNIFAAPINPENAR